MSTSKTSMIKIEPSPQGINFSVTTHVMFKQGKNSLNCQVPGFNFNYAATDAENATKKAKAFLKMYLDYYLDNNDKNAFSRLMMQFYKLGFRPVDPSVILNDIVAKGVRKKINFNFKKPNIPEGYSYSEKMKVNSELLIPA